MASQKHLELSQLLLDSENPRLDIIEDQGHILKAIVEDQKGKLGVLAEHIVQRGLNPSDLPLVVPDTDNPDEYIVVEGNRRVATLKLLANPVLRMAVFSDREWRPLAKKFEKLDSAFAERPIDKILCVVVASRDEAGPWIELKHAGESGGAGTVRWGGKEIARYQSRRGRTRADLQALEFVLRHAPLESPTQDLVPGIAITNLQRLIGDRATRVRLGIDRRSGVLFTNLPDAEVLKGLRKIVEDLAHKRIKVRDIDTAELMRKYVAGFPADSLPDLSTALPDWRRLGTSELGEEQPNSSDSTSPVDAEVAGQAPATGPDSPGSAGQPVGSGQATESGSGCGGTGGVGEGAGGRQRAGRGSPTQKADRAGAKSAASPRKPRKNLVPKGFAASPGGRIGELLVELKTLQISAYPNAVAVLFRVTLELGIDRYVDKEGLSIHQGATLASKLKEIAKHFENSGIMTDKELIPVRRAADKGHLLNTSVKTFNEYVHNRHLIPDSHSLRTAWDNLGPFLAKLLA